MRTHLLPKSTMSRVKQVELLKQNVSIGPTAEEEDFIRFCCRVLDANSFDISAHLGGSSGDDLAIKTTLRGMYLLGAMINHSCISNTRLGFDKVNPI